jgi:hypothetical protein
MVSAAFNSSPLGLLAQCGLGQLDCLGRLLPNQPHQIGLATDLTLMGGVILILNPIARQSRFTGVPIGRRVDIFCKFRGATNHIVWCLGIILDVSRVILVLNIVTWKCGCGSRLTVEGRPRHA